MTQASRVSDYPENWISSQVDTSVKNLYIEGYPMKYSGYKNLYRNFNQIIRKVASDKNVHLIDLANEIPKNNNYIYDIFHFNKKGSELVSEIIVRELKGCNLILKNHINKEIIN